MQKHKTRIALISPNDRGSYRSSKFVTENLGLCYLWSYLEKHDYTEIYVCDARLKYLTPADAVKLLLEDKFDIIGFSIWTREGAEWCSQFLDIYLSYRQGTKIVLGGYFPTLQPEKSYEIIPQADALVMGEGEEIFYQLIKAFENNAPKQEVQGIAYWDSESQTLIKTPRPPLEENLDRIPWPRRYLAIKMSSEDEVFLEGSRGCYSFCTFCAIRPFAGFTGSAWRPRSARSIVDEIHSLRKQNPDLKTFRFIDSDFIGPVNHERTIEFANLAKQELSGIRFHLEGRAVAVCKSYDVLKQLKEAGVYRIYIGIESGSQKILDKMNKRTTVQENIDSLRILNELGIDGTYGFIMFTPWTDIEDIDANVAFLKTVGNIQMNKFFTELLLIPNTPAYKSAKKDFPISLKENDRTYYTYPSLNIYIDRIRKIGSILEKTRADFMEKVWFSYRGIRNAVKQGLPFSEDYGKLSDAMCLDIFNFCWQRAQQRLDLSEEEIVQECIEAFSPQVLNLFRDLSNRGLIKISSFSADAHLLQG
ncbi:B12-binding domain-containing radical SAM protein [Candidatus Odyssella thessalonicensis]|uniref:B12-binding domain-containing radical SAM protein n=1 Tax=Candidatus Odyssella thessalonicensis TaxID=84647 RepID=UPI000225A9FD|nr:radical SAM protein [Candidatus Odyssella thessalonicensis]